MLFHGSKVTYHSGCQDPPPGLIASSFSTVCRYRQVINAIQLKPQGTTIPKCAVVKPGPDDPVDAVATDIPCPVQPLGALLRAIKVALVRLCGATDSTTIKCKSSTTASSVHPCMRLGHTCQASLDVALNSVPLRTGMQALQSRCRRKWLWLYQR